MKIRVLMLTVGGSDKPVITSVNHHKPDYVIFFCTEDSNGSKGSRIHVDGEGLVCQDKPCSKCGYKAKDRPNIVSRSDLQPDSYQIVSVEADNPYDCYGKANSTIRPYLRHGDSVIIDYTGGTKSMTAGLAAAGMEHPDCEIKLVTGKRSDTVKVRDGMERVKKLHINEVYRSRQMASFKSAVQRWDYLAAVKILEDISGYGYVSDETVFQRNLCLCRAFAAWDKFDYMIAVPLIEAYKKDISVAPYNAALKRINESLVWYMEKRDRIPGFDLVYDLLLNAERRAKQGYYNDAVFRTYRALEMYAQFSLLANDPSLNVHDIDIALLPDRIQQKYEKRRDAKGKVQVSLLESYELLLEIGHPVGKVWEEQKNKSLDILEKRNQSILGHGMSLVEEGDFSMTYKIIRSFIKAADDATENKRGIDMALQLPQIL